MGFVAWLFGLEKQNLLYKQKEEPFVDDTKGSDIGERVILKVEKPIIVPNILDDDKSTTKWFTMRSTLCFNDNGITSFSGDTPDLNLPIGVSKAREDLSILNADNSAKWSTNDELFSPAARIVTLWHTEHFPSASIYVDLTGGYTHATGTFMINNSAMLCYSYQRVELNEEYTSSKKVLELRNYRQGAKNSVTIMKKPATFDLATDIIDKYDNAVYYIDARADNRDRGVISDVFMAIIENVSKQLKVGCSLIIYCYSILGQSHFERMDEVSALYSSAFIFQSPFDPNGSYTLCLRRRGNSKRKILSELFCRSYAYQFSNPKCCYGGNRISLSSPLLIFDYKKFATYIKQDIKYVAYDRVVNGTYGEELKKDYFDILDSRIKIKNIQMYPPLPSDNIYDHLVVVGRVSYKKPLGQGFNVNKIFEQTAQYVGCSFYDHICSKYALPPGGVAGLEASIKKRNDMTIGSILTTDVAEKLHTVVNIVANQYLEALDRYTSTLGLARQDSFKIDSVDEAIHEANRTAAAGVPGFRKVADLIDSEFGRELIRDNYYHLYGSKNIFITEAMYTSVMKPLEILPLKESKMWKGVLASRNIVYKSAVERINCHAMYAQVYRVMTAKYYNEHGQMVKIMPNTALGLQPFEIALLLDDYKSRYDYVITLDFATYDQTHTTPILLFYRKFLRRIMPTSAYDAIDYFINSAIHKLVKYEDGKCIPLIAGLASGEAFTTQYNTYETNLVIEVYKFIYKVICEYCNVGDDILIFHNDIDLQHFIEFTKQMGHVLKEIEEYTTLIETPFLSHHYFVLNSVGYEFKVFLEVFPKLNFQREANIGDITINKVASYLVANHLNPIISLLCASVLSKFPAKKVEVTYGHGVVKDEVSGWTTELYAIIQSVRGHDFIQHCVEEDYMAVCYKGMSEFVYDFSFENAIIIFNDMNPEFQQYVDMDAYLIHLQFLKKLMKAQN